MHLTPPPFDGEEAGLATKTTRKMICIYICMWYIDTYESWDIPGQSMAILDTQFVLCSTPIIFLTIKLHSNEPTYWLCHTVGDGFFDL